MLPINYSGQMEGMSQIYQAAERRSLWNRRCNPSWRVMWEAHWHYWTCFFLQFYHDDVQKNIHDSNILRKSKFIVILNIFFIIIQDVENKLIDETIINKFATTRINTVVRLSCLRQKRSVRFCCAISIRAEILHHGRPMSFA